MPEDTPRPAQAAKRLVQCFGVPRRRVLTVAIIDAVLAGQAGEGNPECAQLGGG